MSDTMTINLVEQNTLEEPCPKCDGTGLRCLRDINGVEVNHHCLFCRGGRRPTELGTAVLQFLQRWQGVNFDWLAKLSAQQDARACSPR